MSGILEGVRALEIAAHGAGPLCGIVLGDLGAEVIKIENPAGGDPTRGEMLDNDPTRNSYRGGMRGVPPGGHSVVFEFANKHKKSITADLTRKKGREIVYRLIEKSDIFYSNYLPNSIKRMGMDYETLAKINPMLIYASMSGYGNRGPESNTRAYDVLAVPRSGLMAAAGDSDNPPPIIRGSIADTSAGTYMAFGIVAALLARERQGIGQELDTSLLGPMVWTQNGSFLKYFMEGEAIKKPHRMNCDPFDIIYKCRDGQWIKLMGRKSDTFWHQFCRLLNIESVQNDPRFINDVKRQENRTELIKVFDKAFLNKTRDEWLALFKDQNVDFMYQGVFNIDEMPDDQQVKANSYIVENDHPTLGRINMLQLPINFSKTPAPAGKNPAPQLGEHTRVILSELGYSQTDIAELKEDKVI
ncbi:CaiB/BaiF CoA transferase family protein [Thermodesulfobacteriota bacterium]